MAEPRRWTLRHRTVHDDTAPDPVIGAGPDLEEPVQVVEAAELDTLRSRLAEAERQQGAMKQWAESLQADLIRYKDERDQANKALEEAEAKVSEWVKAAAEASHWKDEALNERDSARGEVRRLLRVPASEADARLVELQAQADKLTSALKRIEEDDGAEQQGDRRYVDEWTQADAFARCQEVARSALQYTPAESATSHPAEGTTLDDVRRDTYTAKQHVPPKGRQCPSHTEDSHG